MMKVRIYYLFYSNLAFLFMNYAIFLKLWDQMRFEVSYVKLHHRIISDGLPYPSYKVLWNVSNLHCSLLLITVNSRQDEHLWDRHWVSVLERCPSYKESNKGNKQRQGPILGVHFTEVSCLIEVSVKRE